MPRHLPIALAAIPVLLAGCGDTGPPLEQAEAAFAQGHYSDTRVHLANAIDATPNDPEVRILLGRAALAQGDGLLAETAIERAIDLAPERGHTLAAYLAHAHVLQGDPETALAILGEQSGDIYSLRIRAQALLQSDEADQAWTVIETGLASDGDDSDMLALAGQYRLATGNIAHAVIYGMRSLESDAPGVEAYLLNGRIASIRGDLDTALSHYESGLERYPEHLQLHIAAAAIYADRGDTDALNRSITQIETTQPGHPAAIFILARNAMDRGDLERVRELAPALERRTRNAPPIQLLLGEMEIQLGNNELGIRWLTDFRRFNPYHAKASFLLAHALLGSGEPQRAYAVISEAAGRANASPQAVALAARLARQIGSLDADRLARRASAPSLAAVSRQLEAAQQAMVDNDWDAAANHYARLLDSGYEDHPTILNNAAMASLRAERPEQALRFAEQAHALLPDDPSIVDTLGWVRLETGGSRAAALSLLQRAAQLDPGNAQIRWHLAQALAVNGRRADARAVAASLLPIVSDEQRTQIEAFREALA
ncbi:tetratricopeptide repeat protein [Parasphingopyxis sp. CP4]|uniref:tetratricopeptide repeat protein n=1 Tax=Parasphingopyxis sp. CP4 TaxID=2724527 RepID=UPI0015A36B04|nr:tetratricopeptide repeat protein [Parasphingopyxis sp. CP4]QLC23114.1 tetratricopeptide repeat protein [Parasphingopyxis sp. CP4]